jgi:galactose oxidase
MADEMIDRCYHSTAILLPDAIVLSAGRGEYRPDGIQDYPLQDSHRDAQSFTLHYLFRNAGARPDITSAPSNVT